MGKALLMCCLWSSCAVDTQAFGDGAAGGGGGEGPSAGDSSGGSSGAFDGSGGVAAAGSGRVEQASAGSGGQPDPTDNQLDDDVSGDADTLNAGSAGAESCPYGCWIAGTCFSVGEANPENVCEICDTEQSSQAWSSDEGKACDDKQYCTVEDTCTEGQCLGKPRDCDDGVSCTDGERCDDETDQCVPGTSNCEAGQFCDVETDACATECQGCVIDDSCVRDAMPSSTNPCLICDAANDSTEWSIRAGQACDDGDACTTEDSCTETAQCQGTAVQCEDDPGVCGANRSCDPGTGECVAQFPGNSISCDDADGCTVTDRCNGAGECAGSPMDCTDPHECTTDTCQAGVCVNQVVGAFCLIDDTWCVPTDYIAEHNNCMTCQPTADRYGWTERPNSCLIYDACYSHGETNPDHGCQVCDTVSDKTDWTLMRGYCLLDRCYETYDVNPNNACQYCDPAQHGYAWQEHADSCHIGGSCFDSGDVDPDDACQVCDPVNSSSAWTSVDEEQDPDCVEE